MNDLVTPEVITGGTDGDACKRWLGTVHAWLLEQGSPARLIGGLELPAAGSNYASVEVVTAARRPLRLVFNGAADLVAACEDEGEAPLAELDFVDLPHAQVFTDAGYRVLRERELCAQIPRALLEQMPKTTRREIRYHGAERVGDLIFNWFD